MKVFWTPQMEETLRKLHPDISNDAVAQKMGIPLKSVEYKAGQLGLKKSHIFWKSRPKSPHHKGFPKEHTPWNKGLKGVCIGGKETQFPKGNLPHNTRPLGTVRIAFRLQKPTDKPFLEIKVGHKKWIPLARWIFIQYYGEVPKGMVIRHKNGQPFDNRLENLECVSQYTNRILNHPGHLLPDGYVASTLLNRTLPKGAERDKLKAAFLAEPELINLKRNLIKLKRHVKRIDNAAAESGSRI